MTDRDIIRRLVELAGSQERAADLLHVSQPAVSDWLRERREPMPGLVELARRIVADMERDHS